jgi:hypothetical protein
MTAGAASDFFAAGSGPFAFLPFGADFEFSETPGSDVLSLADVDLAAPPAAVLVALFQTGWKDSLGSVVCCPTRAPCKLGAEEARTPNAGIKIGTLA